tara:strand:- start:4888 stop:5367 length:480 start_codon:yes stop_codon:yes gene_type:complete
MTKIRAIRTSPIPTIDRDSFLTPFEKIFDQIVETQFPDMMRTIGIRPYEGSAYPKVNVYEYSDKVSIVAEIPGLDKTQLVVDVQEGVLTISGDKHGIWDEKDAKVIRRELKSSSFKRSFQLGDLLDGDKVKATFKDGILSIEVPKQQPVQPQKKTIEIA